MPKIEDLFTVVKGQGGYIRDFEVGTTPLVSATNLDNGIRNFVADVPKFKSPAITVERVTGSAFVQLIPFSTVPDDLSVLIPKEKMTLGQLYMIASIINRSKWRFSFARKLTPKRLKTLEVPTITESPTLRTYDIIPKSDNKDNKAKDLPGISFESVMLVNLFIIKSGDFHKAQDLPEGTTPLISCGTENNGIMRYCQVPKNRIYENALTVAYNGQPLTTYYHPYKFAAKDDVAILWPRIALRGTTLIFVQIMLNRERWRYSYGRKCYNEKLTKMSIPIPMRNGQLDEDKMSQIIERAPYWKILSKFVRDFLPTRGQ